MARAKVLVLVLLACGAASLAFAGPAAAKTTPCWKQVLNDWTQDQVIDEKYPSRCIDEAIDKVPEDIRAYTDFVDQAEASRQANARSLQNVGPDGDPDDPVAGSTSNPPREREPNTNGKDESPVGWVLGTPGNNADGVPIPLLVLLGLAAALITAGGAGFAARKLRARRAV